MISNTLKGVKSFAHKIKNSSDRAKKAVFASVAAVAIFACLSFTGVRIAYRVNYSGNMIATVSSRKQFDDALELVINMVEGNGVEKALSEPEFNTTMALSENINNTAEVAGAIIENTQDIVEAAMLSVDGSVVLRAEKDIIDSAVNNRIDSFNVESKDCISRFEKAVSTETGYFITSDLDSKSKVESVVNSLSVITQMRQVTDIIVPYTTTVKQTGEQPIGFSKVEVSGVAGVNRLTQDIVMINGEVRSCVDVGTEVVLSPVNEVIVKGTAKSLAYASQKRTAHDAGFIFPLSVSNWKISSYYGDGRNHKGVDICTKSGTAIYAVAGGRVVASGWHGAYGYRVIIEHENGVQTLYAHAKQLCCNVGDTVSQGEVIALVGMTGQATGNHLHFEVIANGRNVDPAPYINLD